MPRRWVLLSAGYARAYCARRRLTRHEDETVEREELQTGEETETNNRSAHKKRRETNAAVV